MMEKSKVKTQKAKPQAKIQNFKFWLVVFTFYFLLFTYSFAQPISSSELINNADSYDGKIVSYSGEAIGERMQRGEYGWVNVHDGQNAIGIWLAAGLSSTINYTGSYNVIGDEVEVSGVFNRSCPQHGGDLDIHAQTLRKINPGRQQKEKLNTSKKNFALVLLGALCAIWILTRLKIK